MLHDIFTNKWTLGGIVFLLIFAGLCYLYYHYTTAPYRENTAELDRIRLQSEKQRIASAAKSTEQAAAEKSIIRTPIVVSESDANTGETGFPVSKSMQEVEAVEKRRVSPHGFGPYPEVPSSFIESLGIPIWLQDEEKYVKSTMKSRRNFELIDRVLIKLWNEGDQDVIGGVFENGKVYPTYRDVIYLTEKTEISPTGMILVHRSGLSGQPVQLIPEKVIPEGMRIIDRETGGINPYQFLNLNQ